MFKIGELKETLTSVEAQRFLNKLESSEVSNGSVPTLRKGARLNLDRFSISLREPTRTVGGQSLVVTNFDRRLFIRHMSWHLLFRGITILEWFILIRELEFSLSAKRGTKVSWECLYGILSLSTNTRKGLEEWTSRTKPLFKKLSSLKPKADSNFKDLDISLLDWIMAQLQVPQKALPKRELYMWSQVWVPPGSSPAERYVGVGYKDKGSMTQGQKPVPEPVEDEWTLPHNSDFQTLKNGWISILEEFSL